MEREHTGKQKVFHFNLENNTKNLDEIIKQGAVIYKQQIEKIEQLTLEKNQLQKELRKTQEQLQDVTKETNKWNTNLDEVKDEYADVSNHLEQLSLLLGYRLTQLELLDSNLQMATLYYNDECFVKFTIGAHYNLQQIFPKHPNFNAIRIKLHETNDLAGLLAILRKYFDIIIELSVKSNLN